MYTKYIQIKGKCAYHAVTPCDVTVSGADGEIIAKPDFNADFPIEISTENIDCMYVCFIISTTTK